MQGQRGSGGERPAAGVAEVQSSGLSAGEGCCGCWPWMLFLFCVGCERPGRRESQMSGLWPVQVVAGAPQGVRTPALISAKV